MGTGDRELATTDEATVFVKPLFDLIAVENNQGDGSGSFANSASTNETIGIRFLARSNIFSINSSRPKKVLEGRGRDSPGILASDFKQWANW